MIDTNDYPSGEPGAIALLKRYESPNVTFFEEDGSWPIVWERAKGMYVWDENGSRYLDLTAAFGVAALGHANPAVVRAARKQTGILLHAMGDVHPHRLKAELVRELSRITFERWKAGDAKTILCNSGFEAVEAALKTAFLHTGRDRIVAFEGAYHGLGYGALNVTHREHFRSPFRRQLSEFASFLPWPKTVEDLPGLEQKLKELIASEKPGALLVEPVQARGGIRIPPGGFLAMLRKVCTENNVLLILDEIYTGFGRTGRWFACEYGDAVPDIICLGKAMTGGFPLSACVGSATVMDKAWPRSSGEAIHTSTFLGHPVGCAMALANIAEIEAGNWVEQSSDAGVAILQHMLDWPQKFKHVQLSCRGMGLMIGVELTCENGAPATAECLALVKELLQDGYIVLPEGEFANVIGLTPPLIINKQQAIKTMKRLLQGLLSIKRS
ncbi:MAG: aspartate aminotransferase family protein [Verrucomicrobiales bacterium]